MWVTVLKPTDSVETSLQDKEKKCICPRRDFQKVFSSGQSSAPVPDDEVSENRTQQLTLVKAKTLKGAIEFIFQTKENL